MHIPDYSEKAHPCGKEDRAWNWMGFGPPGFMTGYGDAIPYQYLPYFKCFGEFYGIGDGTYWSKPGLESLTDEMKVRLIKILLNDYPSYKNSNRPYLGLNADGTINTSIDPYVDRSGPFWGIITPEQCRMNKFPHNQRSRMSDGYYCNDCGSWISADSEEYKNDRFA